MESPGGHSTKIRTNGIALRTRNSSVKVLQLRIRSAESCVRIFVERAPVDNKSQDTFRLTQLKAIVSNVILQC